MKKSILIVFLIFSVSNTISAQEIKKESKHLITAALGYSYIPKGSSHGEEGADGVFIPSLGLDYFYKISPKWEIGLMTDFEFGEYVIFEKDLNRKNAIVITAIASYSLTESINLFAGGGIEFEESHNLVIVRVGGEYAFKLNKGWIVAPGFFYDFKEGIDTWSFSVAFGKEF